MPITRQSSATSLSQSRKTSSPLGNILWSKKTTFAPARTERGETESSIPVLVRTLVEPSIMMPNTSTSEKTSAIASTTYPTMGRQSSIMTILIFISFPKLPLENSVGLCTLVQRALVGEISHIGLLPHHDRVIYHFLCNMSIQNILFSEISTF